MKKLSRFIQLSSVVLLFSSAAFAQSSGGAYSVTQSVIANGGGQTSGAGNVYTATGTSGQTMAGTSNAGGTYGILDGYWAATPLAPTAGTASVAGRVTSASGNGLRNVVVVLSGGNLSAARTTRTNSFGRFAFEDVEVGQVYVLTVQNKKYGFPQESQIISLQENVNDILFQAGR